MRSEPLSCVRSFIAQYGLMPTVLCFASCTGSVIADRNVVPHEAPRVLKLSNCPPAGTFVPVKKLLNNSFAPDYAGCDVKTKAKFFMLHNQPMLGVDLSKNIAYAVVPPDNVDLAPAAALFAFSAKSNEAVADFLLNAEKGDLILISGRGHWCNDPHGSVIAGCAAIDTNSIEPASK